VCLTAIYIKRFVVCCCTSCKGGILGDDKKVYGRIHDLLGTGDISKSALL